MKPEILGLILMWCITEGNMNRLFFLVLFLLFLISCQSPRAQRQTWYKGNTHCHTLVGDGDMHPFQVVEWYHDHGYHFLVLSEHNTFITPDTVQLPDKPREDFILIPGEKVTDRKHVHTTAMNISGYVPYSNDPALPETMREQNESLSKSELLQMHVDSVRSRGGITFLNHPNWRSGLQVEDIHAVSDLRFLELYSSHSAVHNWGNENHVSVEEKWDELLSRGHKIYGIAADDAHDYYEWQQPECNPGRAWIMVQSDVLSADAITQSVSEGRFYSSSGVILEQVTVDETQYRVKIDTAQSRQEIEKMLFAPRLDPDGQEGFTIEFIGEHGRVLETSQSLEAVFLFDREKYVRCRVTFARQTPKGIAKYFCWTQPVWPDRL
jgi:hypothetical protein